MLGEDVIDCVVKVFVACSEPNYAVPWANKLQEARTGTAFPIYWQGAGGLQQRWLLTNAHVVRYGSVVQVRRRSDHQKFIARVLCKGLDCDLAVLTVDDAAFWKDLPCVELELELPELQDEVTVVGFPIGGDNTCVTVGVVSRIDMQRYSLCGSRSLLAIQIDAAINPGNSGGPCFRMDASGGKAQCIGVAFQVLGPRDAENVGFIIPIEVVQHFLEDFSKDGSYRGFGSCGFSVQPLESAYMRSVLGLRAEQSGALVRSVDPSSPASKVLERGDVILKAEGQIIGNDGKVEFRGSRNERVDLGYLMTRQFVGDRCSFSVLRKKKPKEVQLPLAQLQPLVPADPPVPPPYFSVGGLIFIPLTEPFLLDEYGQHFEQEAPIHLVWHWAEGQRKCEGHEVIVLSQVLASALTVGFTDFYNVVLLKFNGKEPKNLNHLIQMVHTTKEPHLTFDIERDSCIILPRKKALEETSRILEANMIRHDRSVQYRKA